MLGGHRLTGEVAEPILAASKKVGENFWRMPIPAIYEQHIDSKIADVKNTGNGRAAMDIAVEGIRCAACASAIERGLGTVSVDDIMKAARMAKGSFYRYFDDQADLVTTMFQPVRALVVRCRDGAEFGSAVFAYPGGHQGVLLDPRDHNLARQHPGDDDEQRRVHLVRAEKQRRPRGVQNELREEPSQRPALRGETTALPDQPRRDRRGGVHILALRCRDQPKHRQLGA